MTNLAIVYNRDNSQDLVNVFVRESNGNYYVFKWPSLPYKQDNGRSIRPEYIQFVQTSYGSYYCRLAQFFVEQFPDWVKY